jgi:hypothetical protein
MTKEEVIKEFCKLSAIVGDFSGNRFAHDCFCDEAMDNLTFSFDERVINFIRNCVLMEIHNETK